MQPGSHVVVGYRTPEVWPQRAFVGQHGNAVNDIPVHEARLAIKSDFHTLARDGECNLFVLLDAEFRFVVRQFGRLGCHYDDGQLGIGDALAGLHQRLFLLEQEIDIEQHLVPGLKSGKGALDGQVQHLSALRCGVEVQFLAVEHRLAIDEQLPTHFHIVQVTEEELVPHGDITLAHVHVLGPDVLVVIGRLIGVGIPHTVGTHEAVAVEVVVTGVVGVVVASV